MKRLDKHTTLEEIKVLLDDAKSHESTIEELKIHVSDFDDVKGLIALLRKNKWDYTTVKSVEQNANTDFNALLKQAETPRFPWLKVAAVIIPLVGLSLFYFLYFQQSSEGENLYSKYYVEEKGLPTLMSDAKNKKFDEAMAAYKDNAYEEAESGFDELLVSNKKDDTLLYFLGCTNMELEDFENAIKMFKKVDTNSVFKEKAEYNLSLCFIKIEDFKSAKDILTKISEDKKHPYYDKALKILEEPVFN
ncbi:MAG: hypothetical protein WDZ35_06225 [Crocinitomicaceae bacterium]